MPRVIDHSAFADLGALQTRRQVNIKGTYCLLANLSDAMRHHAVIAELRARIAKAEDSGARHGVLPFGIPPIDRRLPAGGIATGAP